jgi:hypothetical protein
MGMLHIDFFLSTKFERYNLFLYYPSVNVKREWECPRYS